MKKAILFVFFMFGLNAAAGAAEPVPQPPAQNPHPPQSAEDKRRVDFAVQQIIAQYGPKVEIKHPHVIPWAFKQYTDNKNASNKKATPQQNLTSPPMDAPLPGSQAMSGPILKPDEYMVHVYVRFPNDITWHHLDVILSEDASGQLIRRGFYSTPMPPVHVEMPPGVVC